MVVSVQQASAPVHAPLLLPCVLSNTAHLSEQWQYTKPAQINSGTDTKTVPASKTKGQCVRNTPYTLILANRVRSSEYAVSIYQLWARSVLVWRFVSCSPVQYLITRLSLSVFVVTSTCLLISSLPTGGEQITSVSNSVSVSSSESICKCNISIGCAHRQQT